MRISLQRSKKMMGDYQFINKFFKGVEIGNYLARSSMEVPGIFMFKLCFCFKIN